MEIGFYSVDGDVNGFLYNFLLQLVQKGRRITIFSESEEKARQLDETLWTRNQTDFLPHGSEFDGYGDFWKEQPLFITTKKQNINGSDYLLISNYLEDEGFFGAFEKTFYVFSASNIQSYDAARQNWDRYKARGAKLRYITRPDGGKWQELDDFGG